MTSPDERLRRIERLASSGDVGAGRKAAIERQRQGETRILVEGPHQTKDYISSPCMAILYSWPFYLNKRSKWFIVSKYGTYGKTEYETSYDAMIAAKSIAEIKEDRTEVSLKTLFPWNI